MALYRHLGYVPVSRKAAYVAHYGIWLSYRRHLRRWLIAFAIVFAVLLYVLLKGVTP